MSNPVRRLLAAATTLLVLGGAGIPAPASAQAPTAAAASVPPCAAANLSLREALPRYDNSADPGIVFVLRNQGSAECRLTGGVGIQLFDASGNAIPLRFAPRTMMAMLLTLAPDAVASFTVTFGPHEPGRCSVASRIEVTIPGQTASLTAPTTIAACSDAVVTVSNLRLGTAPVTPSRFLP